MPHPWLYELAAKELMREGKIVADAPPGRGQIPDPRRFVYLEGCGELNRAALAFAVRVRRGAGSRRTAACASIASHGTAVFAPRFRCRRQLALRDIQALRAQALRARRRAAPLRLVCLGPVRLTRINRVFMLDQAFTLSVRSSTWQRHARRSIADGPPVDDCDTAMSDSAAGARDARHPQGVSRRRRTRRRRPDAATPAKCTCCSARTAPASRR